MKNKTISLFILLFLVLAPTVIYADGDGVPDTSSSTLSDDIAQYIAKAGGIDHIERITEMRDGVERQILKIYTNDPATLLETVGTSLPSDWILEVYQPTNTSSCGFVDTSGKQTYWAGDVWSNAYLWLFNTAGIVIASTCHVDVAGFVASTLKMSVEDFTNFAKNVKGDYNVFKDGRSAYILNEGRISARPGGFVVLLAQAVENAGVIIANTGKVILAAGERMTLSLDEAGKMSVVVDEGVLSNPDDAKFDSAVKNSGQILAEGSKVVLTAKVLNNVFKYAINNTGIIEANSIVNHNGSIELIASGAPIINSGDLISRAGKVVISDSGAGFINTITGRIIVDGYIDEENVLPNAGIVDIKADTILHQGFISANAAENGNGGDVSLISENSTILDEGSTTEAKASGAVGNGGRVTLKTKNGKTLVKKNARIDLSAGLVSGNAGTFISDFDRLGFYGVLSGRAPPGGNPIILINEGTSPGQAVVETDEDDYPPDGTPIIPGAGFSPNSAISITITAPDGSVYTLTAVTDAKGNFNLTFTPSSLTKGNYVVTSTDGTKTAITSFTDGATKLVFITPARTVAAGAVSAILTIQRQENDGTPWTNGNITVSLSSSSGTGKFYSDAAGNNEITSVAISNGSSTASFYYKDTKTGTPTLTASKSSLTSGTQQETITPGAATGLSWVTQPSSPVTAGATWNAFSIEIVDQFGNRTADTFAITVTPSLGSFASGTTTRNAVAGLATFNDLKYNTAQTITVNGTSAGLTSTGASNNVTVNPDVANNLNFVQQPTAADYGTIITPAITVEVRDQFGNRVTSDNVTNVAIAIGTNPGGGTLVGTTPKTASNGLATFDDLSISLPGTGYTLAASAVGGGLTGAASVAFNVTGTVPVPTPGIDVIVINVLATNEIIVIFPPTVNDMTDYQYNTFNGAAGGSQVYFYHPLTPSDMEAFNALILNETAYQFINGRLTLIGHDGLVQMFEELKKKNATL